MQVESNMVVDIKIACVVLNGIIKTSSDKNVREVFRLLGVEEKFAGIINKAAELNADLSEASPSNVEERFQVIEKYVCGCRKCGRKKRKDVARYNEALKARNKLSKIYIKNKS